MSSSKSSQTQQQTFTDNRTVQGEGALYAGNGATLNNYVLDGGAIQASFDASRDVTGKAFSFGGRALDFASDAMSDATGQVSKVTTQAFNFGTDAMGGALQLAGTSLGRVLDATADTQKLVADAYNDAKGRGAMTDKLLMGAVAAMAIVAAMAVKKG